jgi:type I restriction enzyme S subunit
MISNWHIKSLNDVSKKLSLNKLKIKQKDYLQTGLFPVIDQGKEFIGGYYNDENLLISDEPPYILFGDHTKVKKFVPFKFIPGADGVKVLKPKNNILPKFLYYLLFTIKIQDKGYARHFQLLEKENFLIPESMETQQAIIYKIEELFSDIDKGIEDLKLAQQQLKVYRQSVLKWAFEGKLTNEVKEGELPKGWKCTTIGEVCHNVEYGSATKSTKTGKIPVLRMGNIQNGIFDWSDLVYSNDENDNKKYLLKKHDVLFNRTNSAELVGKTAIFKDERPAIFAGYLIRINRKDDLINGQYLTYYMNTHAAKSYGNKVRSFGVNQSNINGTKLKTYPIPLPLINEQVQIVQEIESRLSLADKMEENIKESLQHGEALRQSILKKAFSGELI